MDEVTNEFTQFTRYQLPVSFSHIIKPGIEHIGQFMRHCREEACRLHVTTDEKLLHKNISSIKSELCCPFAWLTTEIDSECTTEQLTNPCRFALQN
jgi:uncharacterized protein YllA (UPF0747 family)